MSSRLSISAVISLCVALLLWGVFGFFAYTLSGERAQYAALTANAATREDRDKTTATLRTLLRDTREEREALDAFAHTDVLAAAATIESAGKIAGIDVFIESAVSAAVNASQSQELQTVTIVANAEGRLPDILEAAALFESLPFPAVVESYDIRAIPNTTGRPIDQWRMTTRLRLITMTAGNI